jgi:purine nucleosidase
MTIPEEAIVGTHAQPVRVLLDTDIGSDVDDAIALAYLLGHPDCELVGITTVSGDVGKRAALAQLVCTEAGQPNIPIVAGAALSLTQHNLQPNVPQSDWLDGLTGGDTWIPNRAVNFLNDVISSSPHQITLLTIGPLTNIAALFAAYPDTAAKIANVVSMGGRFFSSDEQAEWNIRVDPVAAAVVFSVPVAHHHVIGLDVTLRCRLEGQDAISLVGADRFSVVSRLVRRASELHGSVTLHDPLAAACVFDQKVVKWQSGWVKVDLADDSAGQTSLIDDERGPRRDVARDVDVPACVNEIRSKLV